MAAEDVDPVVCEACGARFPVERFSERDHRTLDDQFHLREFTEELQMLERVSDFYARYPDAEGRIKPHVSRILESTDPDVVELLCSGVAFDAITLPPDPLPLPPEVIQAELEVIDYLRNNEFALSPRLEFVRHEVHRLGRNNALVACPSCRSGRLQLGEHRVDPLSTFF